MSISVAIVGSGPSGFYTAEALMKKGVEARVDIIERLPTPYGLIRGGVAPDHQSTKRVIKAYERTALRPEIRFYGNVAVGRDVTIAELKDAYDAVVLAIGAPCDRTLGIPGDALPGVIGSAAFVGWYNGHPDFRDLEPDLSCRAVAVVGNGNVAIDVARVLTKTAAEMAATDIPDYAAEAIQEAPITDVYLLGRRGATDAKFTNVELREMGKLENCAPIVDPQVLPDSYDDANASDRDRRLKEKNLATLREFAAANVDGRAKRVHFCFNVKPVSVLGESEVEGVCLERTRVKAGRAVGTGETFTLSCGLVIPAIGYQSEPLPGVPFDANRGLVPSDNGRVEPGLYAVGWIKRGPTGVIGTNKPDGDTAAEQIAADLTPSGKGGREALEGLLQLRGVRWVSFGDWQAIDRAEIALADEAAPRRKFVTVAEMLAAIGDLNHAAE